MNALEGTSATGSGANAIDYFRRSSDLGFAPAQVVLGYLYETGRNTADPHQALEWYRKAARQDDPLAQWLVGREIYLGEVPPRDLNQAASWLERSSLVRMTIPLPNICSGKLLLNATTTLALQTDSGRPQKKGCRKRSGNSPCCFGMVRVCPWTSLRPTCGCWSATTVACALLRQICRHSKRN
jgi:hypothetical protein